MERQKKAYAFALSAVFFWSTVATAFKIGLRHLSVLHLILVASITSCLVFFLVILIRKRQVGNIYYTTFIGLIFIIAGLFIQAKK